MEPNSKDSVNYQNRKLASFERPLCSLDAKHTKCPEGYLQWHAWAEEKSKTHRTEQCPGCGLYAIWVPRRKRVRKARTAKR